MRGLIVSIEPHNGGARLGVELDSLHTKTIAPYCRRTHETSSINLSPERWQEMLANNGGSSDNILGRRVEVVLR